MIEQIRQIVAQVLGGMALTRMGEIIDYDPDTYSVRVRIQPTGEITGWLPLGAIAVGKGFGIAIGPNIGDQVRLDFEDGHWQAGMVGARFFSDVDTPMPVPAGECWIQHQSTSSVKLTNDGKVSVRDQSGSTLIMNGDNTGMMSFSAGLTVNADMQINGNVKASGDISDQNGAHGTLTALRDAHNGHEHPDPQGGNVGLPTLTV